MTTQIKERRGHVAKSERAKHFLSAPDSRPWRKRPSSRSPLPRRGVQGREIFPAKGLSASVKPFVPAWKRWLDIGCIFATLPLSIPLLLAVTLWIRLVSRGPALFRQKRIGLDGKPFTLYKFRSMHHGARNLEHEMHVGRLVESDSPMVKLDLLGDSRLIPGGCFLRTAGLDELPQFLNVLRGQMSLVGPRPCLPGEFEFFSAAQRKRFEVLPGLTGLWQVSGKNCTTFKEMNLMDLDYSGRSSPVLDVWIMLRTPMALLRQMYQCGANRQSANRLPEIHERKLEYVGQRLGDRV